MDPGEAANDHADWVRRELAWNRERWSAQTNTSQWRPYGHELRFAAWLQTVSAVTLVQWVRRYLPPVPAESLSGMRWRIRGLQPMPEVIARAYFFDTVSAEELGVLAGAPYPLDQTAERHVALVCHRLLAFHAAKHSRFGPGRVSDLMQMLERWRRTPRPHGRTPDEAFNIAKTTCLCLQRRLWRSDACAAMDRVHLAMQRAQDIFEGKTSVRAAFHELNPTKLALTQPCAACEGRQSVIPT